MTNEADISGQNPVTRVLDSQAQLARRMLAMTTAAELRAAFEEQEAQELLIDRETAERYARPAGYETLTTNTSGARSNEWFARTGFYFSTGYATACLAVAVYHPEIGVAGSHKNVITIEDTVEAIIRERAKAKGLILAGPKNGVNIPRLEDTVRGTVREAVDQFAAIAPEVLPETGVVAYVYGMTLTPQELLPHCSSVIKRALSAHPLINASPGAMVYTDRALGLDGEIMYGGPDHPLYPEPTFVV